MGAVLMGVDLALNNFRLYLNIYLIKPGGFRVYLLLVYFLVYMAIMPSKVAVRLSRSALDWPTMVSMMPNCLV